MRRPFRHTITHSNSISKGTTHNAVLEEEAEHQWGSPTREVRKQQGLAEFPTINEFPHL